MNMDLSSPTTLRKEDFHRLGLPRYECRLDVIRQAAARCAAVYAQRQLELPSLTDQDQLSRLATSTYRVLDPRQREDVGQRVHIGRILRCDELVEGTGRFQRSPVDGGAQPNRQLATVAIQPPATTPSADVASAFPVEKSPLEHDPHRVRKSLHAEDLLQAGPMRRGLVRRGRQFQAPWVLALLVAGMFASTVALATWRLAAADSRQDMGATLPHQQAAAAP